MRELGNLAWWASPRLSVGFLRPLSSLTHWIDFQFWPTAAWAMHLSNSVLYGLSVWVAALLYRELLPGGVLAAVAALMFAIDEAHAPAAGWIASRNTLLAVLFALLALLVHVRAQTLQRPALRMLSASCLGLALSSGEGGVAALAYLVAYALVFESGPWLTRLRSVAPQGVVFAGWAIAYAAMGCGMRGTSWYHELGAPFELLREGLLDTPLWLLSLFGPSMVGLSAAFAPSPLRLIALCLIAPLLVGLMLGLPRSRENRFFALALILCFPALFATIPQERVTFAATFAAFGLIASLLEATRDSPLRALRWYRRGTLGIHFGIAPLLFMSGLKLSAPVEHGAQALIDAMPDVAHKHVVLVNEPVELLPMYTLDMMSDAQGTPRMKSLHALYSGASPLSVERSAPDALEIRSERGWGRLPIERIFCAKRELPKAGSERAFSGLRVSVLETDPDGLPTRVRFRFPTVLESPERVWLVWRGTHPTPWQPPALGERVTLPGQSLFESLAP
jgi:hypothetical protein